MNTKPKLFDRSFWDVDQFAEFLNSTGRSQVQIDQLSLNSFFTEVWLADFGNLQVSFAKFGCPMHHLGERANNAIHFALFLEAGTGSTYVHGHPLGTDHFFGFDSQRGSDTVLPAGSTIADVLIEQNLFAHTCHAMRREDLNSQFLHRDIVYLPTSLKIYKSYLQELLTLQQTRSPLLHSPDYRRIIVGDLLPLLIDAIPRQKSTFHHPPAPSHRAKLVRQAKEFIQGNLHRTLTLKDIYTHLGISRRTLYYSFESIFEMTPMEYLKAQRLLGSRRSLKQSTSKAITVSTIAHQYGFWDLANFSKAYKAMFNELPSQTLNRPNDTK